MAGLSLHTRASGADDPPTAASGADFRLRFSWRIKSEYAFFLFAEGAGLYRARGLDVGFVEGTGALRTIAEAVDDHRSLAVVPASFAMTAIDGGAAARIVALYQRSANVVLLSRQRRPLRIPADLEGKTVAHVEGEVGTSFLEHLCRLNGVDFARISFALTDSKGRIEKFRRGEVDVISVYRTNDLKALEQEYGEDLCLFDPAEFGLAVPGMSLLGGERAMEKSAEAIGQFLAATDRAIATMRRDPDRVCVAYLDRAPGIEAALLRAQIDETIGSLDSRTGYPAGYVDSDVMRRAIDFLSASGKLSGSRAAERFYTNRFFSVV